MYVNQCTYTVEYTPMGDAPYKPAEVGDGLILRSKTCSIHPPLSSKVHTAAH